MTNKLLNLIILLFLVSCSKNESNPSIIKLDLKNGNYLPNTELIFNLSENYYVLKSIEFDRVPPPPLDENDFRSDHDFIKKNKGLVDSLKQVHGIKTFTSQLSKKDKKIISETLKKFDSLDFKSQNRYNYGLESELFLFYNHQKNYSISPEQPKERQKIFLNTLISILINNENNPEQNKIALDLYKKAFKYQ
ncbi:hypothetical protein AAH994_15165 [Weeksellaceae bacterium A-14]